MSTIKVKNPETGLWEKVGIPSEVKGMTMDLLWENPDTSVEFPAQTVELDLSGYDFAQIVFSAGSVVSPIIPAGDNRFEGTSYISQPYDMRWRYMWTFSNGIVFDNAYVGKSTVTNHVCLPLKIYGLRNTPVTYPEGGGTTESIAHPGCFYRMVNGVQEWLNPPMELGVEYKTTERYLGKPVYVQAVSANSLPIANNYVAIGASTNDPVESVLSCVCVTSDGLSTPHRNFIDSNNMPTLNAHGAPNGNEVYIVITATGADFSDRSGVCTVRYTKTTD